MADKHSSSNENDVVEVEGEDETSGAVNKNVSKIMNDPEVLAAIQNQLPPPKLSPQEFYKQLPAPYKRRVKALKKLQLESTNIEAEFYQEVHKLECKYASRYEPLNKKRNEIVNGKYEPNDDDCDFPSDVDEEEEEEVEKLTKDLKEKAVVSPMGAGGDAVDPEQVKGLPGFWYTIFRNVEMLSDMVMSHDEPLLLRLADIQVELQENPMGFRLAFHFLPNEYFTNTLLTKTYEMSCKPDDDEPFNFEGPEIIKCTGCKIDWKAGKNITVRTVQKKQKHKSRGAVRTITKTVQNDSFFNFFNPPQPSEDGEVDEDTQALLTADFEIGHFLRERVIPRAILFYTGEAIDDDDDEELDEEGEEEEDDDDDDDDEEVEIVGGKGVPARTGGNKEQPAECKQQ